MIKIPTILGLGILLIATALGVFLTSQNQIFFTKASVSEEPKNINQANLNDTSVSIYWETVNDTTGFIKSGTAPNNLDKTSLDVRDQKTPQNHRLHFVTISDLQPETTYYYQIQSGKSLYPSSPSSFKTSANMVSFPFSPITGNITDNNFEPIKEAIITINLPNAQKIAAITMIAGNFIFPLTNLKTEDLSAPFPMPSNHLKAKLLVNGIDAKSEVDFNFPLQTSTLPSITLGKNIDLTTQIDASSSGQILLYDLNSDGIINAADISLLFKNFGKVSSFSAKFDLNKDGAIDQKDVNLLIIFLK